MQKKCLNIIVYYNNYDEINSYLRELQEISDGIVDVAIVVNSNTDGKISCIIEQYVNCMNPFVTVFDFEENVGYLNSLLNVIEKIQLYEYRFVILSNTDVHYCQKDFFSQLMSNQYENDVGSIAPCVYATKTKSYSNPHYMKRIPREKFLRLAFIFKYPCFAKFYLSLAAIKDRRSKKVKKPSCYVYSPHGCYMIFTNNFIQRLIGYRYGVLMYSEESFVGELLNKYGLKCYYDDSLNIQHHESSVTGKINYKKRFSMWRDSIFYILNEFY